MMKWRFREVKNGKYHKITFPFSRNTLPASWKINIGCETKGRIPTSMLI
jgi:hypothetical protein